jgi:hypothetical protein
MLIGKHLPAEVGQVLSRGPVTGAAQVVVPCLLLRVHGSAEPAVAHDGTKLSHGFSASCQCASGCHAQKPAHELSGC